MFSKKAVSTLEEELVSSEQTFLAEASSSFQVHEKLKSAYLEDIKLELKEELLSEMKEAIGGLFASRIRPEIALQLSEFKIQNSSLVTAQFKQIQNQISHLKGVVETRGSGPSGVGELVKSEKVEAGGEGVETLKARLGTLEEEMLQSKMTQEELRIQLEAKINDCTRVASEALGEFERRISERVEHLEISRENAGLQGFPGLPELTLSVVRPGREESALADLGDIPPEFTFPTRLAATPAPVVPPVKRNNLFGDFAEPAAPQSGPWVPQNSFQSVRIGDISTNLRGDQQPLPASAPSECQEEDSILRFVKDVKSSRNPEQSSNQFQLLSEPPEEFQLNSAPKTQLFIDQFRNAMSAEGKIVIGKGGEIIRFSQENAQTVLHKQAQI